MRLWAAARAAAGVSEVVLEHPGTLLTVADVQAEVVRRHGAGNRLPDVLAMCSVLLGEVPVGARERSAVEVPAGGTVEFLPPFAGG